MDWEMFAVDNNVRPVKPLTDYVAFQFGAGAHQGNVAQRRELFSQWVHGATVFARSHCSRTDLDSAQRLLAVVCGRERPFDWYPPMTMFEGDCNQWALFMHEHGALNINELQVLNMIDAIGREHQRENRG